MGYALTNDQILELAPAAGATSPIAGVSDKYSFVSTLKALELLRDVGWVPIEAQQSRAFVAHNEGYQKHMIRLTQSGFDFGDERVDLVLINSHNRGSSFKLIASIWRKICGNGMMTDSELSNFTHNHIGFSDTDFMMSAASIAASAGKIAERVEDLKMIELSPKERILYAEAAHTLIFKEPERAPVPPADLLVERRYDDEGNDLWTTFNVVQEHATKGGLKGTIESPTTGKTRKSTTRAVKSIDRNVKLNQVLWTLTEKMVELKAKGLPHLTIDQGE